MEPHVQRLSHFYDILGAFSHGYEVGFHVQRFPQLCATADVSVRMVMRWNSTYSDSLTCTVLLDLSVMIMRQNLTSSDYHTSARIMGALRKGYEMELHVQRLSHLYDSRRVWRRIMRQSANYSDYRLMYNCGRVGGYGVMRRTPTYSNSHSCSVL